MYLTTPNWLSAANFRSNLSSRHASHRVNRSDGPTEEVSTSITIQIRDAAN